MATRPRQGEGCGKGHFAIEYNLPLPTLAVLTFHLKENIKVRNIGILDNRSCQDFANWCIEGAI